MGISETTTSAIRPCETPQVRRCFRTKTTDGTEYIAEFDDNQTAAVRHTVIHTDGKTETYPQ